MTLSAVGKGAYQCPGCKDVLPSAAAFGNHIRFKKCATPEELFWAKVKKTDSCWLWQGFLNNCGYGRVGRTKSYPNGGRAHRVSWEMANGNIPAGMDVLHHCDVRHCVNPAHLWIGTHRENMLDAVAKGRNTRGAKNTKAKLTEDDVRTIRRTYWCKGKSSNAVELAAKYGVGRGAIVSVTSGRYWKHVK